MRVEWKKVSVGLPDSRWGHTSVNLPDNQGFVVFGGNGTSSPCNDIQVYQNNKWINIEATGSAPQPRYGHSAALFICKNTSSNGNSSSNSNSNSSNSSNGSSTYYQIIIYGGRATSKPFRDTKILHINSQGYFSWKSASKSTYEGRAGHSAIAYRQKELVVFGGYNNNKSKYYNNLQIFSLDSMEWKQQSTEGQIPSGRAGHSAFLVYDRYMFIFGGFDGKRYYNDLYYLDLLPLQDIDSSKDKHSFQWKKVDLKGYLPKARSGHSATMIQSDKVLIFGGCGSESEFFSDIHILHLPSVISQNSEFKFEQPNLSGQPLPFPRFKHTANFIDNKLFIFSGTGQGTLINDLLSFEIYDDNNISLARSNSSIGNGGEILNNNSNTNNNGNNNPLSSSVNSLSSNTSTNSNGSTSLPVINSQNGSSTPTTTTTTTTSNHQQKNSSNGNQHLNRLPLSNNVIQVNNMQTSNNLLPESLKFTLDNNLYQQKDVNKLANIINSTVSNSTNSNSVIKKLEDKLKLEQKKRSNLENELTSANQCIVKLKEQLDSDDISNQLHLKSILESKKLDNEQISQKVIVVSPVSISTNTNPGEESKEKLLLFTKLELELNQLKEKNKLLEIENKALVKGNLNLRGLELETLELEDIITLENTISQSARTISQAKDQLFIKQMAMLRKEKEQLQEQSTCVICAVNPANVVLLPCRHSSICSKCSKKLLNCPLCRAQIENQIERFT